MDENGNPDNEISSNGAFRHPEVDGIALVGIVGSLRADAFNYSVMASARELLPPGVQLTDIGLRDVPLYDGDEESLGVPAAVETLQRSVDEADGLVIFTPEYNRSVPAVTKNAVDWLSRPNGDSALARSTVGIVAATPGNHRVAGVIDHLSASISANTPRLYDPSLGIGGIAAAVGEGRIIDPAVRAELVAWLDGFVDYVRAVRRGGLVGADAGRRS